MAEIFVFGTLKQDFPNFEFNSGTKLGGSFTTVEKYPLYLIGPRYSPWMINNPGVGFQVEGEVFEVNSSGLKAMDDLERVDKNNGSQRMMVPVQSGSGHGTRDVFVYLKPLDQYLGELEANNVQSGPWSSYTIEHSLLYRSRKSSKLMDLGDQNRD